MVNSPLSFSATEQFRKRLIASNLQPYFVKDSSSPQANPQDVGVKETEWIDTPLVNQTDLSESGVFEKIRLNTINQYGPENGFGKPYNIILQQSKSNQGEFVYNTDNTRKFSESEQEQNSLLVLNQFGPQDGWADGASQLENNIIQYGIRGEYFSFTPSTYTPGNILLEKNPVGNNGPISNDSALAQIAANRLRSLFEESIAIETYQETLARANALQAINDPYVGLKIATGNASIIEPDWNVTTPDGVFGTAYDLISRITGVYSPYSLIPGDYFTQVKPKNLLNQAVNFVSNLFGFPSVLPERKSSSDIFLANTGQGTRRALFGMLDLNRYAPDYRANFLGSLNLNAPKPNYYIGSRTSEPLDIVSPSGQVPVDEFGIEIQSAVYGNGVLGGLYENDINFNFGLNSVDTFDGGGLQGGFTWVSPKYKGNAGFKVGKGSDVKGTSDEFPQISAQYTKTESTNYALKKGSILDDTQRIIDSQPRGGKRLQHVGNAIDQVSKVFNDGYKEITKGSRVIRYVDNNGIFKGEEYGRIFAKDIPFYQNSVLQKTDGNIRKNPYSILDKTYNLNMYPTSGPDSTTLANGQVKKYMLSLENLAWRTSRRPGLRYTDLPESEKGPNGGRIMWFPPYDVGFSENNSASWEANQFLGRPEAIYTYRGTTRGGNLSFKIVVDHPSIMNVIVDKVLANTNSNELSDGVLNSFFAGLTKFDIYELAKRYQNFTQTELAQIQNVINNSGNRERIKDTINKNLNKGGDGAGGSMESNSSVGLQNYIPQLGSFKSSQFYFDYNQGGGTNFSNSLTTYEASTFFGNIETSQQSTITSGYNTIESLCTGINNLLTSNNNVTIQIRLRANSSYNEATNVKSERNTCIEDTIKSLISNSERVVIKKIEGSNDETIQPQNYVCSQQTTNNYSVGAVGCRRVIIEDIIETPLPNLQNPNGSVMLNSVNVVDNLNTQDRLQQQINRVSTESSTNPSNTISKQVIRKLLSEADYFEFLKESNPFVYDSLREKLKYFHPAFHSMTPEGLNERLTFLVQCTRPGDTIPTKQADGTFLDKDARNTGFGAPPVCVLRIGDFYHSKVIVETVNFTYEDAKFDLNPEGIGVQPMIVGVSIGFKFIGGQSLRGPVEELQNALSFNFFANTEMYDERAVVPDISAYSKEFIEKTEQTGDTPQNTDAALQNEGGSLIGDIKGNFTISGTVANNTYEKLFKELVDNFEVIENGMYDKLKELTENYNQSVLKLYTKDRKYSSGSLNEFMSKVDLNIFGKSSYVDKVNAVFNDIITDIDADNLTILNDMLGEKFPTSQQSVFRQQLKDLVNKKKTSFLNGLTTITNDLSSSQLKIVRTIDKINYVLQSLDGYIDKKGNALIYDTQSASTINELLADSTNILSPNDSVNGLNEIMTKYNQYEIITNDYNNDQAYTLLGGSFNVTADMRFYLIFGYDLTNNYKQFETEVIGSLSTDSKWKKFIENNLTVNYKVPADKEKKLILAKFKEYRDYKSKASKWLVDNWNALYKKNRNNSLLLKSNPTSNDKERLKNLYLGVNSNEDDKFNGKVRF
jgi:hypothetical protein